VIIAFSADYKKVNANPFNFLKIIIIMSQESPTTSYRTSFESTTEKEPEVIRNDDGSPQMRIAKITSRGEEYFERYGGDDIHEPPPKEFLAAGGTILVQSETTVDANMITWDGPNDPLNPQNWSIKYKWLVTVVCTVMTLNV
jgi:MFS transporter, DHA1 family, multidrug resistance protein